MSEIHWHDDLSAARDAASASDKLLLTYLHAPG